MDHRPQCICLVGLTASRADKEIDQHCALCWGRFQVLAHQSDLVFGFTTGQRIFTSCPAAVLPETERMVMLFVPRTQDPEYPVFKNRPVSLRGELNCFPNSCCLTWRFEMSVENGLVLF